MRKIKIRQIKKNFRFANTQRHHYILLYLSADKVFCNLRAKWPIKSSAEINNFCHDKIYIYEKKYPSQCFYLSGVRV